MVSFGFHWYIQVKEPSVNFVYVHPWLLSFRPRNENLNLLVRIKSLNLYLYCSYKKINNLLVGTKFYWSWAGAHREDWYLYYFHNQLWCNITSSCILFSSFCIILLPENNLTQLPFQFQSISMWNENKAEIEYCIRPIVINVCFW